MKHVLYRSAITAALENLLMRFQPTFTCVHLPTGRPFIPEHQPRGDRIFQPPAVVEPTLGQVLGEEGPSVRQGRRLVAPHAVDHHRHRGGPQEEREGVQPGKNNLSWATVTL